MNQDQVKEVLLRLEPKAPDFVVIFTGKASRKVNGLYKPETREILLHNKNFNSDEELIYTAVHEFAHHVHFCSPERPRSARSHTMVFWSVFHRLLARSEELGIYRADFSTEPEFAQTTARARELIATTGRATKDLGQVLLQAVQLCGKHHVRFEDYVDRALCLPRATVKTAMASFAQDLEPEGGVDHLKVLTSVKDPEVRRDMELKRREGYTPPMIRQELGGRPLPEVEPSPMPDPVEFRREILTRDLERARRALEKAKVAVSQLEERIQGLDANDETLVAHHRQISWRF